MAVRISLQGQKRPWSSLLWWVHFRNSTEDQSSASTDGGGGVDRPKKNLPMHDASDAVAKVNLVPAQEPTRVRRYRLLEPL